MIPSLEESWKRHWTRRIPGAVKESGPRTGGIPHRDRREAARTVLDQQLCRTAVISLKPRKDTWRVFWTNTQIYYKAGRTGNWVLDACLQLTFTATFKPECLYPELCIFSYAGRPSSCHSIILMTVNIKIKTSSRNTKSAVCLLRYDAMHECKQLCYIVTFDLSPPLICFRLWSAS